MVRKLLTISIIPFLFACSEKSKVVNLEKRDIVEVSPQAKKEIKKIVSSDTSLPDTKAEKIEKVVEKEKVEVKKHMEKKIKKVLTPYREEKIKKETALLKEPITPVKLPDKIIRILLLPYVDDKQAFHSGEYLFVKVEEGKWILGKYIHKDLKRKTREFNPLVEVKQ